ncbi:MAG: hypothetical protein GY953_04740 [bacterium]|nr:hypothetical protein [bacterium]
MMAAPAAAVSASSTIPQVAFGNHQVSRLMVGGNPVSGNSHFSGERSRAMLDYFTAANVVKLLADCDAAGINTWQSRGDRHIRRLLHEYRLARGRMHWIAQTASEFASIPRNIRDIAAAGAIGVYHHGSKTDSLWRAGRIDEVREMLKVMRDTGLRTGLGTHIPEVIDHVESSAWDVDFYMTCCYNLSRTKQEASRLAGKPVTGEFFWEEDPKAMLQRVRRTSRQCLIFKVYAAGRRCGSPAQMLSALSQALSSAKPTDCLILGMFPKQTNQAAENSRLFRQALAAARHGT